VRIVLSDSKANAFVNLCLWSKSVRSFRLNDTGDHILTLRVRNIDTLIDLEKGVMSHPLFK
jgi:hypothetical protein